LVIHSEALAVRQIRGLHQRLARAEQSLAKLAKKPGDDPVALPQQIQAILKRHDVAAFLTVDVQVHVRQEQRYVGPGRPGPNRTTRIIEHKELGLSVQRQIQAIQEAETLAGWRLYVTNAPAERLSLAQAVHYYREEWQPERGFHRFKRGALPALPIYLQDEERTSGLMFLLTIALRVFTLMEFVVRRQLAEEGESLTGLYDGNPQRKTNRPTAERLLVAFRNITLYCHPDGTYEMSPLSPLQRQILILMGIPESIYAIPESAPG
jgi:transposase